MEGGVGEVGIEARDRESEGRVELHAYEYLPPNTGRKFFEPLKKDSGQGQQETRHIHSDTHPESP